MVDIKDSIAYLRSPHAIREQSARLYAYVNDNGSRHFSLRLEHLPKAADHVVAITKRDYPNLDVPYHSRWRHFSAGGPQHLQRLAALLSRYDVAERARAKLELAVVSVLLDAGAGMAWRYQVPETAIQLSKSEGLAIASLMLFCTGAFSSDHQHPARVDPEGLKQLKAESLAAGFQVNPHNPLTGLDGRLNLLWRLAEAIASQNGYFQGAVPRLGNLFDYIAAQADGHELRASAILEAILEALGSIWPGRTALGSVNLGDTWMHSALPATDKGRGLVPFHKLSQWLSYSLVELFEEAGFVVSGLDDLTGLPEYRNGGLFLDTGVIALKRPEALNATHQPGDELIVEWRALTIILLDQLAAIVRERLGLSPHAFPLAKVLQGGTWTAGREIARSLRVDGGPPLKIASDGTVF